MVDSSESSISEASNQEEEEVSRKAEENDLVADLNLTARNAGEDSQREIMLDPAKIDTSMKENETQNPKKLKPLNSIDTVFEKMDGKGVVIEVKDEKIEKSKLEEQKKQYMFDSIS